VEVDFGEFLDELEEAVGFVELLNLLIEGEVAEEGAVSGRRPGCSGAGSARGLRVCQEFGEVVLASAVELLLRRARSILSTMVAFCP